MAISLVLAGSFAAAEARSYLPADALSVTCWLLVAAGVIGMLLAGRGSARGWLLLVMLQPMWVVYAVATGQHGFVIGALASWGAQVSGYLKARGTDGPTRPDLPEREVGSRRTRAGSSGSRSANRCPTFIAAWLASDASHDWRRRAHSVEMLGTRR